MHFDEARASLLPGAKADSVDYLGKLAPDEIYKLRTEALVTVLASRWENQSYATLEAMLQGCPTVSSDAGGQGEIIVDGVTGRLTRLPVTPSTSAIRSFPSSRIRTELPKWGAGRANMPSRTMIRRSWPPRPSHLRESDGDEEADARAGPV